ncbi:MAG TPA: NAD(P)-dependent oxidoreductase [Bryobacteraceae bacterium]|jgi:dTDP-4-dehydrorhamnose reductase|nr:NAD(P)-dependent oxidoreductase [Bryobacteraceae bacterium]
MKVLPPVPRMLVIGATGFLGGSLMRSRDTRFERIAAGRIACDVTDPASVRLAFVESRPDVVILTAALADIDRCEKEPELARAINVHGAENVAKECARLGVRLLFTSSGAIFDGTSEGYHEAHRPSPLSVYGKTKAEAEQRIREIVPDAAIVRLSLALGHSPRGGTNALVDKLEAAFRKGNPVYVPPDEFRNAIDVDTLSRWILDLAHAPNASGIFHLGASNALSRYEIVRHLAQAMGYSTDLVVAQDSALNRAPRGRRQLLIPARIAEHSGIPVPTCLEAIERCLHVTA